MRSTAATHLTNFQQAFIRWRWPARQQPPGSGIEVAAALERWLAQYPEHAETIGKLSLGACLNAVMLLEWETAQRVAAVGLSSTQLGALASAEIS